MTPEECRIIVNCMKATIRDRPGEGIAPYEYELRVGASVDEVERMIAAIAAACESTPEA
jgi:hypothetical protein